jgi:hypothetical protein
MLLMLGAAFLALRPAPLPKLAKIPKAAYRA